MKKLIEKHENLFGIGPIFIYVIINSLFYQKYGINHHMTTIGLTLMSVFFLIVIKLTDRVNYYGLKKGEHAKEMLYYIPLFICGTSALWGGINTHVTAYEITFHILSMINVGFLEEIVFRGFLYRLLEKESLKKAIIVTSITFGIGHIVNLLNGADLIPTLFQIGYALSLGFLFAIVLYKGKSLIPCICTHMMINSLSIFLVDNFISSYITPTILIIIPILYALYILKKIKD